LIEILLDHSYEDNYFMISAITVSIKDPSERERIENRVKSSGLEGSLIEPDNSLAEQIAKLLDVDKKIIDFDTNEIDL
jgi:hypothetical protein